MSASRVRYASKPASDADAGMSRTFAESLKRAREAADLSQFALAELIGWKQPNIAKIESFHKTIVWATAYRLIVGAKLGLEYFFPETEIIAAAARIKDARRRGRRASARRQQAEAQ